MVLHEEQCSICLTDRDRIEMRGKLPGCDHLFCFTCISEWAKQISQCPLCKTAFRVLNKIWLKPVNGFLPHAEKVFIRSSALDDSSESDDAVPSYDSYAVDDNGDNQYDLNDSWIDDTDMSQRQVTAMEQFKVEHRQRSRLNLPALSEDSAGEATVSEDSAEDADGMVDLDDTPNDKDTLEDSFEGSFDTDNMLQDPAEDRDSASSTHNDHELAEQNKAALAAVTDGSHDEDVDSDADSEEFMRKRLVAPRAAAVEYCAVSPMSSPLMSPLVGKASRADGARNGHARRTPHTPADSPCGLGAHGEMVLDATTLPTRSPGQRRGCRKGKEKMACPTTSDPSPSPCKTSRGRKGRRCSASSILSAENDSPYSESPGLFHIATAAMPESPDLFGYSKGRSPVFKRPHSRASKSSNGVRTTSRKHRTATTPQCTTHHTPHATHRARHTPLTPTGHSAGNPQPTAQPAQTLRRSSRSPAAQPSTCTSTRRTRTKDPQKASTITPKASTITPKASTITTKAPTPTARSRSHRKASSTHVRARTPQSVGRSKSYGDTNSKGPRTPKTAARAHSLGEELKRRQSPRTPHTACLVLSPSPSPRTPHTACLVLSPSPSPSDVECTRVVESSSTATAATSSSDRASISRARSRPSEQTELTWAYMAVKEPTKEPTRASPAKQTSRQPLAEMKSRANNSTAERRQRRRSFVKQKAPASTKACTSDEDEDSDEEDLFERTKKAPKARAKARKFAGIASKGSLCSMSQRVAKPFKKPRRVGNGKGTAVAAKIRKRMDTTGSTGWINCSK